MQVILSLTMSLGQCEELPQLLVSERIALQQRSSICVQVRGFWAQLEAATNERQQAMFRMLNVHLARLAQRVETVVGDLLEVCPSSPVP